jgi:hypothetical protein
MTLNVNNEDDYYETSDFDMIHFDEEYDEETGSKSNPNHPNPGNKRKSIKKKKRLEDWLEEKRLRDELHDENLDP